MITDVFPSSKTEVFFLQTLPLPIVWYIAKGSIHCCAILLRALLLDEACQVRDGFLENTCVSLAQSLSLTGQACFL